MAEPSEEAAAAAELVRLAKEQGLSLTRPHGLLQQFTKTVLETASNEEMEVSSHFTEIYGASVSKETRQGVREGKVDRCSWTAEFRPRNWELDKAQFST